MSPPGFIVPGIGNSGPSRWQSLWQAAHPDWQRLAVDDWDQVACRNWVAAIERQLPKAATQLVIVAHSLGCLAVAHWVAQASRVIRGALLVAVPDPASAPFPRAAATGFAPLPSKRFPFPCIVVSSTNDHYGSADYARACAQAWGSEWVDAGAKGHVNAASNLGDWPEGFRLIETIRNR